MLKMCKLNKCLFALLLFIPGLVMAATEHFPTNVKITKLGTNIGNLNWIMFTGSETIATTCAYSRIYFDFNTVQGKSLQSSLQSSQANGRPLLQLTYIDGQTVQGNANFCMLEEVVTGN